MLGFNPIGERPLGAIPLNTTAFVTGVVAGASVAQSTAIPAKTSIVNRYRGDNVTFDGSNNVTQWSDQSGNANHATRKDATNPGPKYLSSLAALGNQPVVDFRRTLAGDPDNILSATNGGSGVTIGTWGAVVVQDSTAPNALLGAVDFYNTVVGLEHTPEDGNTDGPIHFVVGPSASSFASYALYNGGANPGEGYDPQIFTYAYDVMHNALVVVPTGAGNGQFYVDSDIKGHTSTSAGARSTSPSLALMSIGGQVGYPPTPFCPGSVPHPRSE